MIVVLLLALHQCWILEVLHSYYPGDQFASLSPKQLVMQSANVLLVAQYFFVPGFQLDKQQLSLEIKESKTNLW